MKLLLFILTGAVYFLPSIIAIIKDRERSVNIFMLNLLLGWTVVGWIGAFFWALIDDKGEY